MSFIFYFAVLIVSGATVLFGLDLMTSPLPASKPRTEATSAPASNKLAQRVADRAEEVRQARAVDDRALTPVYPAAPASPGKEVRMVYPPTNEIAAKPAETTGSANADNEPAQSAEQRSQAVASAPATEPASEPASPQPALAATSEASNPPITAESAVPQPAAQHAAGQCNISACAAAYNSFRASDCTYQPFSGPRRLCEKPIGASQRIVERGTRSNDSRTENAARVSRQVRIEADLRAVEQRVKQLTADEGDVVDLPLRGRRVIVIEQDYVDSQPR